MALSQQALATLLQDSFPEAEIVIQDLAGDGDHYKVKIISEKFIGLPRIKRHQLIYQALGNTMDGQLHALSIQTLTPTEQEI